jgi:hypothetical protein
MLSGPPFMTAKFVSAAGLVMDIDHDMVMVKARDGDDDKKRQFMLASGMNGSALEHSVPEQLFSTPENPVEGISAVKALQIANEQGIPIYTVTKDNIATVLPQLELYPPLEREIMYSAAAGMEVTVSKTDISYNGWTGCGYIVINPVTGSGAYMISGGMAGAIFYMIIAIIFFAIAIAVAIMSSGALIIAFASILANIGGYLFLTLAYIALFGEDAAKSFMGCFLLSIAASLGITKLLSSAIISTPAFRYVAQGASTASDAIGLGDCFSRLE